MFGQETVGTTSSTSAPTLNSTDDISSSSTVRTSKASTTVSSYTGPSNILDPQPPTTAEDTDHPAFMPREKCFDSLDHWRDNMLKRIDQFQKNRGGFMNKFIIELNLNLLRIGRFWDTLSASKKEKNLNKMEWKLINFMRFERRFCCYKQNNYICGFP